MSDEKLDRRLREAVRDYNSPPPVPRQRLWVRIEARRAADREAAAQQARKPVRSRRLMWWPVAAAAVLILGIAIGRWGLPTDGTDRLADGGTAPQDAVTALTDTDPGPRGDAGADSEVARTRDERTSIYRYAAAPIFGRAEILLTEYRTIEPAQIGQVGYTGRARRLLDDTRLLLDSPAAEDPALGDLLSDLELVLAQIVHIADKPRTEDKEWIEQGISKRSLLPRLRNQVAARVAGDRL